MQETASVGSLSLSDTTIRVDVGLLDKLMNLVGELVLTRNQMLRCSLVRDEAMFQASSQRLNLITTELQEGMMKTRMQPIRNLTSKLPRVVRDLAIACGKQAAIVIDGEETELDKTLSEAIKDPITHIVRNSVDHGIETAEVRVARGKSPQGTILLRAYHEGGMVNIEVSDDGNGIDPVRIRKKALERGWLNEEQAALWSDRELLGLIFRPGFSTAESLTMVSGRGVGMDVVKSRIESIGGSVDVSSRVGIGTTMKMKIPLTLTIINALIVSAGGDRFAIPQVNLVELIRLKGDAIASGLIEVQGTWVARYRGRLLPLVDLNYVLRIGRSDISAQNDAVSIVVLQADQHRFGLVVDRIDDAQEIVVRPLARQLKGINCLAGATIMGDGKIALILDAFGLAKQLDGIRDRSGNPIVREDSATVNVIDDTHALILLRGTDGGPYAIPLVEVDRLETFAGSSIEWIAGQPLVQYRKCLLPLIDVAGVLKGDSWIGGKSPEDGFQVVIHETENGRLGLVFDRVLDIVEERLDVRGEPSRPGVTVTAVIQGRATEVLDIPFIRERHQSRSLAGRS
jgi:two-component system chemotaxis sensor kinase CheA